MADIVSPACPSVPVLEVINTLIRSGRYDAVFSALKGFRNGLVYGTRVRAPHALVMAIVWSHAPWSKRLKNILSLTKTHALCLGMSGLLFSVIRALLRAVTKSKTTSMHAAIGGMVVGYCFWGDANSAVHQQVMMYMLARVLCALVSIALKRSRVTPPADSFRWVVAILWALNLFLLYECPESLQHSMRLALDYIYKDTERFSSWFDVLCVNSSTTF